jgi:anti-anti-sigma regulatory factor
LSAVSDTASRIALASVLDNGAAGELKRNLAEALDGDRTVEADAGEVRRVSTLCLQVLVAAAAGGRLRLSNVPAEMRDAASLLGLTPALGLGEI